MSTLDYILEQHIHFYENFLQDAHNTSYATDGDEDADESIINNGECGGIKRCTGNLGKVLKESVHIAFTYAKVSINNV